MERQASPAAMKNGGKKMTLPKWAFDKEYATEWRKEVEWLKGRAIEPTFVKVTPQGVRRYKYTKTAELFAALAVFYKQVEEERSAVGVDNKLIAELTALAKEDDTL